VEGRQGAGLARRRRREAMKSHLTRRQFGAGVAVMAGAPTWATSAWAQAPKAPVTLNVVDVAGNLALTQKAFELYAKTKPNFVAKFNFTKAPAPELPGKIKAQQAAKSVDIDVVLTGTDALAAGLDQDLWIDLKGQYADKLPKTDGQLLKGAEMMAPLAKGRGMIISYYPSGPLLEYMPNAVKNVPTTAEELLGWAKANPNKFLYARPANSGPGRTFLMGLPYILGDKDPKDPIAGWDKTWAYLKELGQYIEYYPTGTGATMKELGEGTRDMIASTTGWDINPRVLGIVPKEAKVQTLKGFSWVIDAHYMCVPKGVAEDKLPVILDLMAFMLTKEAQAFAYDEGYFYPGPVLKDVPLSMAPESSQKALAEFGRPEYDKMIADNPLQVPLDPEAMVKAFRKWDEEIGAAKGKK
jgi:putative spermidine/putrescine transport system substrate-binding protein